MPQGDKGAYTRKQKRQAEHIEESTMRRGRSRKTAERIAWATVNKQDGGGKRTGSGRGRSRGGRSSRSRSSRSSRPARPSRSSRSGRSARTRSRQRSGRAASGSRGRRTTARGRSTRSRRTVRSRA